MRARWIGWIGGVVLAGCGGVYSANPASDADATRTDERLVGFWRVEPAAGAESRRDRTILAIGRAASDTNGAGDLEVVSVTLKEGGDKPGRVETSTTRVRPTTIAERPYASVSVPHDEKAGEVAPWVVLRYEVPDADTVIVRGMQEKAVASDVRAGAIAGDVSESKAAEGSAPVLTVTLKASTADLRAFLARRGDAIYRADSPLVLRRLRVP
jgi:hypothetical protein